MVHPQRGLPWFTTQVRCVRGGASLPPGGGGGEQAVPGPLIAFFSAEGACTPGGLSRVFLSPAPH